MVTDTVLAAGDHERVRTNSDPGQVPETLRSGGWRPGRRRETPISNPTQPASTPSTTSSNFTAGTNSDVGIPQSEMCKTLCGICKIRFCLALVQCFLGIIVTSVGLYLRNHTPTLRLRDTPYWAGVLLLVSGIFNLYLCSADIEPYSTRKKATILKVISAIVGTVSVFVCLIAATFPAILASRMDVILSCPEITRSCQCFLIENSTDILFTYNTETHCHLINLSIKGALIVLTTLNVIGSLSCMWFVILVWKSRYS